jgi:two-component system phosphate regulon sensor histidine kinase PhoR
MRGIYEMFEKIRGNDFSSMKRNERFSFNSFRQIHHELYDYAQNKQSEIDELKQLAKFRRQFLADVSHELKTPIFAAQGFVYTLIDGAIKDKENRMKFLKKAAKNLDGLDALVQDLLTVSHMEAGDITMHMESVNLVEIIYEIFDQLEHTAHKGEVTLTLNHPRGSIVHAVADNQRIRQVLLNLITNAVKYSKINGVVAAIIREKGTNMEVVIKDDGIGIPKEH